MGKPGSGFGKQQSKQMTVQIDEVTAMQTGYENRITAQIEVINRLQTMLTARTDQLTFQMQQENSRAAEWSLAPIEDIRVINRRRPNDNQTWTELMFGLIPIEFLSDYPPEHIEIVGQEEMITVYLRFLQGEVEHRRSKEQEAWLEVERREAIIAGKQDELNRANRSLAQATADARHNANQANAAFKQVEIDDDTPPWEQPGYVPPSSSVVPSVLERNTPIEVSMHPAETGDSETIQFDAFAGSHQHPGEQRPGSF